MRVTLCTCTPAPTPSPAEKRLGESVHVHSHHACTCAYVPVCVCVVGGWACGGGLGRRKAFLQDMHKTHRLFTREHDYIRRCRDQICKAVKQWHRNAEKSKEKGMSALLFVSSACLSGRSHRATPLHCASLSSQRPHGSSLKDGIPHIPLVTLM